MLLPKEIDALALAVDVNNQSQYGIQNIAFNGSKLEATNGHSLYTLELNYGQAMLDMKEFPVPPGDSFKALPEGKVFIPPAALKKAIANRPKKTLAILENIVLQADDKSVALYTTDLNTSDKVVGRITHKDTNFPDFELVYKQVKDNALRSHSVTLGIPELEKIVKMVKKLDLGKFPSVTLSVTDDTQPVAVVLGPVTGAVMPIQDTIAAEMNSAVKNARFDQDLELLTAFRDRVNNESPEVFLRGHKR